MSYLTWKEFTAFCLKILHTLKTPLLLLLFAINTREVDEHDYKETCLKTLWNINVKYKSIITNRQRHKERAITKNCGKNVVRTLLIIITTKWFVFGT